MGLNLTDAQSIDFVAALEPIVQHIETSDKIKNTIRQHITGLLMGRRQCHNLSAMEKEALEELQRDSSIIILPADKGRATVVMDKPEYNHKVQALLDDTSNTEPLQKAR